MKMFVHDGNCLPDELKSRIEVSACINKAKDSIIKQLVIVIIGIYYEIH